MNFVEYFKKELMSRGMFENQAVDVIRIASEVMEDMTGRWNENITAYPPVLKNILWINIEDIANKYIKEKCPMAWFAPMFDREHPVRKEMI